MIWTRSLSLNLWTLVLDFKLCGGNEVAWFTVVDPLAGLIDWI